MEHPGITEEQVTQELAEALRVMEVLAQAVHVKEEVQAVQPGIVVEQVKQWVPLVI